MSSSVNRRSGKAAPGVSSAATIAKAALRSKYCSVADLQQRAGLQRRDPVAPARSGCGRTNANGVTTSNRADDPRGPRQTVAARAPTAATATRWGSTIRIGEEVQHRRADQGHARMRTTTSDRSRRAAATTSTVSQTAHAVERAYDRASIPAHVMRGRMAKAMPAHTATVRLENCLAEHHDAGGGQPDREATRQPKPELGGREDRRTTRA